jgi:hypothetical protein
MVEINGCIKSTLTNCRSNLNNELLTLFGKQDQYRKVLHGRIGASASGEHLFAIWRPEARKYIDSHAKEGFAQEFCLQSNGASYNVFKTSTICLFTLLIV